MSVIHGSPLDFKDLLFAIDPALQSSYPGSGSTVYNLIDDTTGSLVNFNYNSTSKIWQTPNVGDFFYIQFGNQPYFNTLFNKTSGGWTIIEWVRVDNLVYPRAAAGGMGNAGYGSTSTRGFDWNHGTQDLTSIRMSGSVPEINPSSTQYDFDTGINISAAGLSLNTFFCRALWWNRSTNTHGVYINGVARGSASHSQVSGYSLYNGGGITLGTLYGWSHTGARGPVYIYNRVLTEEENRIHFEVNASRFGL